MEKMYLLSESELNARDGIIWHAGHQGELTPPLPEPIKIPSDEEVDNEIKEIAYNHFVSEAYLIDFENTAEAVAKYMRDLLIKKK